MKVLEVLVIFLNFNESGVHILIDLLLGTQDPASSLPVLRDLDNLLLYFADLLVLLEAKRDVHDPLVQVDAEGAELVTVYEFVELLVVLVGSEVLHVLLSRLIEIVTRHTSLEVSSTVLQQCLCLETRPVILRCLRLV